MKRTPLLLAMAVPTSDDAFCHRLKAAGPYPGCLLFLTPWSLSCAGGYCFITCNYTHTISQSHTKHWDLSTHVGGLVTVTTMHAYSNTSLGYHG